ncbi:MAG TPA: PqqD family protein [Gemmatimonadales bacterium]
MCQRFDDGAVLLSTRTEVYYQLNEVGATVWELLADAHGLDVLCEEVGRRHPGGDADAVRRDVAALLAELSAEGLIVTAG